MGERKVLKVLLVDDDKDIRELLYQFFTRGMIKVGCDFKVAQAENGEDGIMQAEQEKPDIIFMDVKMPKLDGYQATRYFRQHEEFKDIPIVIVSAYVSRDVQRKRAMEAGADAAVSKPFKSTDIEEALRGQMGL